MHSGHLFLYLLEKKIVLSNQENTRYSQKIKVPLQAFYSFILAVIILNNNKVIFSFLFSPILQDTYLRLRRRRQVQAPFLSCVQNALETNKGYAIVLLEPFVRSSSASVSFRLVGPKLDTNNVECASSEPSIPKYSRYGRDGDRS